MGWFERLVRQTPDWGAMSERDPQSGVPDGPGSKRPGPARRPDYELPTEPIPVVPSPPAEADEADEAHEPRYDPSQPSQAPVAGIDLVTFASLSRQLMDTPPTEHRQLLGQYGHTPETWQAVNTAWIARLGQMPFLYSTYTSAYRNT
jgi:hypothetical protein